MTMDNASNEAGSKKGVPGGLKFRPLDATNVYIGDNSVAQAISELQDRVAELERWMHSMIGVHDR